MEINFDKEIDAILRKGSGGVNHGGASDSSIAAPHLDADEISAFAENALPESAKIRCTAHLADCRRCRKILSNLILLHVEPASETVHAIETAAAIPWYRKFFTFPNFAYTLGALALVFGAMIVFTILQVGTFQNADVSQTRNMSKANMPASAPANANISAPANNMAPANMASNTAATSSNTTAAKSGDGFAPTPAANEPYTCRDCGAPTDDEVKSADKDLDLAKKAPLLDGVSTKDQPAKEEDKRAERESQYRVDPKAKTEQQKQELPAAAALGDAAGGKLAAAKKKAANEKTDSNLAEATKNVGGKTFHRSNNAWYDTAYSNQPTTNVSRGSAEYKNLDGGLRGIAEKLSGVVIVVWKGKAYRIQ